ncbi:hypothetical protein ACEPAH_7389 [Sanghuangporus vaninii]
MIKSLSASLLTSRKRSPKLTVNYIFFLVLDIGLPTFEAIPLGVRFVIGVLQVITVRAAGFATTSLSSYAPAMFVVFGVLCVILMYLDFYPIALSVRATNVYEGKTLGYLAWHARKQLVFDMWWIGLVLFIFCIIERHKLHDEENYGWFTIFALIFEIIYAYAGVGISLGLPYANYSFSGALSTLSKIILVMVMIRGRHRDLPLAIDRAVMLPHEYKTANEYDGEREETSIRMSQKDEENKDRANVRQEDGGAETLARHIWLMQVWFTIEGHVRTGNFWTITLRSRIRT